MYICVCIYIYIYIHVVHLSTYIYIYISYGVGGRRPATTPTQMIAISEFRDVVFEDVVFDNNSVVTLLWIVC